MAAQQKLIQKLERDVDERKEYWRQFLAAKPPVEAVISYVARWACVPNAEMVRLALRATMPGQGAPISHFTGRTIMAGAERKGGPPEQVTILGSVIDSFLWEEVEVLPEVADEYEAVVKLIVDGMTKEELGVPRSSQEGLCSLCFAVHCSPISQNLCGKFVQALVDTGKVTLNHTCRDNGGRLVSPLTLASVWSIEATEVLLKAGADMFCSPDPMRASPFLGAFSIDIPIREAVVRLYLQYGGRIDYVDPVRGVGPLAVSVACEVSAPRCFDLAVELGADPKSLVIPHKLYWTDAIRIYPWQPVVRHDDIEVMGRILALNVLEPQHLITWTLDESVSKPSDDAEVNYNTQLHLCVAREASRVLHALLQSPCGQPLLSRVNCSGHTPLDLAITYFEPKTTKVLLQAGALSTLPTYASDAVVPPHMFASYVNERIVLQGLSTSKLNGRQGKVVSYSKESGRYSVVLDSTEEGDEGKPLAIKAANIVPPSSLLVAWRQHHQRFASIAVQILQQAMTFLRKGLTLDDALSPMDPTQRRVVRYDGIRGVSEKLDDMKAGGHTTPLRAAQAAKETAKLAKMSPEQLVQAALDRAIKVKALVDDACAALESVDY